LDEGMVICLERDADLHMAQLMPLPIIVSCSSKIQIGFTFLVPAHLDSPRQRAIKWVLLLLFYMHYKNWLKSSSSTTRWCDHHGQHIIPPSNIQKQREVTYNSLWSEHDQAQF